MHHLPEVHRNCSCKTFWSTFLVLLFVRACCSYAPLHVTIRQCMVYSSSKQTYFTPTVVSIQQLLYCSTDNLSLKDKPWSKYLTAGYAY